MGCVLADHLSPGAARYSGGWDFDVGAGVWAFRALDDFCGLVSRSDGGAANNGLSGTVGRESGSGVSGFVIVDRHRPVGFGNSTVY